MLPCHIEVAYIPFEMGGPQPGLYLFTQAARMMRPVKQNGSQAPELIGTLEQYNMSIWSVRNLLSNMHLSVLARWWWMHTGTACLPF